MIKKPMTAGGKTGLNRASRLLFSYRLMSRAYFHLPVLLVFLYQKNYGVITIETLLALYGFTILVFGTAVVPLSERLSSKASLIFGEMVKAAGLLFVGLAPGGLAGVVIGQVLSGAGYALTSSVEIPLSIQYEPNAARRERLQALTQSWIFLVVMISGIAGAIVFTESQTLVFYLSAAACLLATVAALPLPKDSARDHRTSTGSGSASGVVTALRALPGAISWCAYYTIIRSVSLACFVGLVPYLLFVQVRVSLAVFGLILGLFNAAAFLVARYLGTLMKRGAFRLLLGGTFMCLVLSLTLMAVSEDLVVVAIAITFLGLGAGAARPLTQQGLEVVPASQRRTLNGRLEQVTGLCNAAVLCINGVVIAISSIQVSLIALAVVVVLSGSMLSRRLWLARS